MRIQARLTASGMRPVSAVVDATNYAMLELGQPLHAFDMDRLAGPGIVVRHAADGERLVTLDDVERTLDAEDLLICDLERPVAIGGVMGGATSEVSEADHGRPAGERLLHADGGAAVGAPPGSAQRGVPPVRARHRPGRTGARRAALRPPDRRVGGRNGAVGRDTERRASRSSPGQDAPVAGHPSARLRGDRRRGPSRLRPAPPHRIDPSRGRTGSRSRCPGTGSTSTARWI